jgi:polysaccharide export outer membrane protein
MGGAAGRCALIVALALVAGCAQRAVVREEQSGESAFRIGREDVLEISVWRDEELSRTVPVRPDGFISLPVVGELAVAGRTPDEVAQQLTREFGRVLHEPRVTVIVREVNSARIFITGEVARPGVYPVRSSMTLVQAIALAGGFTEFANRERIRVIRQETQEAVLVGYSELVGGDAKRRRLTLGSGDTVIVP